jgi:hypothetical protein
MRRVNSDEIFVEEIPLQLFQNDKFNKQLYLDEAAKIVFEGLKALKVSKTELIHVCTGYIFSKASKELKSEGFDLSNRRITGKTQELAEREFVKSLVRLGIGDEANVLKMRNFNSLLRWVRENLRGRERFVKTGWKSWAKYRKDEKLDP